MAENGGNHPDRHRHSRPPALSDRRRRALFIGLAVLVACAVAAVLVVTLQDRSSKTVAETPVARATTIPTSLPTTTPTPVATATATTSEVVPPTFAAAMGQMGIPLDPHTGWVVAQGICVRLGQPEYDQFRLAEGVERLFPSVGDEQAHAFVAMVASTVCNT
jgi:hypothetical protein